MISTVFAGKSFSACPQYTRFKPQHTTSKRFLRFVEKVL